MRSQGLWDDEDGFFYDVLHTPDGADVPIKVRSIVGVLPLLTTVVLGPDVLGTGGHAAHALRTASSTGSTRARWPRVAGSLVDRGRPRPARRRRRPARRRPPRARPGVRRGRVPVAVRAARAVQVPRDHPVSVDLGGTVVSVDYEPAESTTGHVRRQLQLARPGVDAGQLPRAAQPAAQRPGARRDAVDRVPHRQRARRRAGRRAPRTCAAGSSRCSCAAPTAAGPATARSTSCRTTRAGATTSPSTSTSTATTAPGSGATHQTGWTGLVADLICRPDPFDGRDRALGLVTTGRGIAFGREVCGNLAEAAAREWLVTDGLGGYASGTVAGLRTRRYHGLLVARDRPAGASRMLGLAALDAVVVLGDRRIRLATHEWVGGAVDPRGHEHLASFDLDDGVPRWRYDLGAGPARGRARDGARQPHRRRRAPPAGGSGAPGGHPAVHLARPARRPVRRRRPADRAHRRRASSSSPPTGWTGRASARAATWYRGEHHREEAARGLGATEDLWAAGTFRPTSPPAGAHGHGRRRAQRPAPDAAAIVAAARARAGGSPRAPAPTTR